MTQDFLDKAEKAIIAELHRVRPILLATYGKVDHELKYDDTVVTHLDKQIETDMRKVLKALDPAIGIEGEEYGIEGSRETYWLIDPIDGTENFIRGLPTFRSHACLIENGKVIWTLIYYFVTDEIWTARKGKGAWRNGVQVHMQHRPLNRSWFDINVSLLNKDHIAFLQKLRPHISAYVIMRDTGPVISGKVDGYLGLDAAGSDWDFAPRSLLFTEAGAHMTNLGSKVYDFKNHNFILAHSKNFEELTRIIK